MRDGYSHNIRAEAITMRYQRKRWKEIQTAISEKFGIKPSIRQMQKWFENYQGTTEDPTGAKYIAKIVEESAELAKPLAQAKMMSEVMPIWGKLREEYNKSPVDAGWISFLSFFEVQIGRENFDRILKDYLELRDRLTQQIKQI